MAVLKAQQRLFDLIETSRSVVSQLDLDKVLALVLRKAMGITGARSASIALYSAKTGTMRIRAHRGLPKSFIADREWTVRKGGGTARVLRDRSIAVLDYRPDPSFFRSPSSVQANSKSLVCVPLVHAHEVVGMLYVDDHTSRKYAKADLQALDILASFSAVAIHHARTHDHVKQQAITDSLTGLFNRRCFEDIMRRELQRARRHRRELSVALVDVNDFKKYNDAFGHQAGDEALSALGEAVRRAVRSTDLASRYGGDEIVIILPETRLARAFSLFTDRIKGEIESGFARLSERDAPLSVTIGIASYPHDGTTTRQLVLAADKALLAAKKDKKNGSIGCSRRVALAEATP